MLKAIRKFIDDHNDSLCIAAMLTLFPTAAAVPWQISADEADPSKATLASAAFLLNFMLLGIFYVNAQR